MEHRPPTVFSINGVRVDLSSESLRGPDGEIAPVRPQAFATLRYLLQNPDRLVTKTELMDVVWRGTSVTDDSLVQCIHEIRRALRDERHDVLQTVSRRGYRIVLPEKASAPTPANKASLAVLPFTNLNRDPEQDYFADGLVEDLITSLARIPGLLVIARNSSFAYRSEPRDVRSVAEELGVRYLLEGSVRRSANQIRINGQLVDGASAGHIWTGKFNGAAADIFDLQDQLTEQIVGAIEPSVRRAEIDRARRKRPNSLDAYDLYLRALPHANANSPAETDEALRLLHLSLELDHGYLAAHGYAAWCHEQRYFRAGFHPEDRDAALAHADIVLGINSDDPNAISMGAFIRAILTRDYDGVIAALDRALAMNGNSALALGFSALVSSHSERYHRAVDHAQKALRLSPLDDPLNYHPYCALAVTYLFAGQFPEAVKYSALAVQANPSFSVAHAYLVASQVGLGNMEAAQSAASRLLEVAPTFSVGAFVQMGVFRAALYEGLAAALRKAGLP
ncbi:winged helix-turn-helix domain-containing tetratricopeptide repeat protein [Taklimakanibacter lacteus]|uniref:winged helix-turn-helix domain-containing tetratricopeptide repeat protein n=1 Tax=Taklimakanibacter lacteus TaxID=2268456 RepID=UPI000E675CD6